MNTEPAINPRQLHRIHNLCDECETASHCLKNGCVPLVDESADEPVTTPEQAMKSAYAVPTWALVVAFALLCLAYLLQRTA